MKKHSLFKTLLTVSMVSLSVCVCAAAKPDLAHFTVKNHYAPGQFADVPSDSWYVESVSDAYELGLVKGESETAFAPEGHITIAESVTLACRLHSIFTNDAFSFAQTDPWYSAYVDYAIDEGIIASDAFSDYDADATREQFAVIMSCALNDEALDPVNEINVIPDVPATLPGAKAIYALYRAGVLTGNDEYGTYYPDSGIRRCEVAAIVTRMANRGKRKTVHLKQIAVESITFDVSPLMLYVGETYPLTVSVMPQTAAEKTVTWQSSNPSVAAVSENGEVTAVSVGNAQVIATVGEVSAKCGVAVKQVDITSFTLDKNTLSLTVGNSETLTASIKPVNATDQLITWKSFAPNVATVSQNGVVTAVRAGVARISASAGKFSAECVVNVTGELPEQSENVKETEDAADDRDKSAQTNPSGGLEFESLNGTLSLVDDPDGKKGKVYLNMPKTDGQVWLYTAKPMTFDPGKTYHVSMDVRVASLGLDKTFEDDITASFGINYQYADTDGKNDHIYPFGRSISSDEGWKHFETEYTIKNATSSRADDQFSFYCNPYNGTGVGYYFCNVSVTEKTSAGGSSDRGGTSSGSGKDKSTKDFTVPKLNEDYGPFTLTDYYSTGKYWQSNEVTSFEFTKCELSANGKYKLTASYSGTTDDDRASVYVHFFNGKKELGKAAFIPSVTPDKPYNTTYTTYVDQDVIESATRLAFYSYTGYEAGESAQSSSGSGTVKPSSGETEKKNEIEMLADYLDAKGGTISEKMADGGTASVTIDGDEIVFTYDTSISAADFTFDISSAKVVKDHINGTIKDVPFVSTGEIDFVGFITPKTYTTSSKYDVSLSVGGEYYSGGNNREDFEDMARLIISTAWSGWSNLLSKAGVKPSAVGFTSLKTR